MSILQQTQQITVNGQFKADKIKKQIASTGEQLFHSWVNSFDALWSDSQGVTPEEKIAALGTDAAEVFYLSAAMVQFLTTIFTGRRDDLLTIIQEKLGTLPEFTINEDGTVSLVASPQE